MVDAWLDFNHTRLGPETGKIAFNTLVLGPKGDPAKIAEGKKGLEPVLPVLNDALGRNPYLCGAQPTLADFSMATNVAFLMACKIDLGAYKAIGKWFSTMNARPAMMKTAPKLG